MDRGVKPVLRLALGARETSDVTDANVIAELKGRARPDEIVVIGGHLDSWDLASGAHDDGAGVILAIEAARLLRELDLVPRRTIRVVLFANEERGLSGGEGYLEAEKDRLGRHVAAMEADAGGFRPSGFSTGGALVAAERIESLLALFEGLGAFTLRRGQGGADIGPLAKAGVPGLGLTTDSTRYFEFHHSALDTPDKVDPAELSESVAAFALMGWLLAEMPEPLPRSVPAAAEAAT